MTNELEKLLHEYGRLYYCYTDDIGKGVDYQHAVKRMQEIKSQITQAIQRETILDIMNVIKATQESYLVQKEHPEQSNIINTSINSRNMTLRTVKDDIKNFAKDKGINI